MYSHNNNSREFLWEPDSSTDDHEIFQVRGAERFFDEYVLPVTPQLIDYTDVATFRFPCEVLISVRMVSRKAK